MKKYIFSTVCAASLFTVSMSSALADKIAVVEDLIFIAQNTIVVKNVSNGLVNQCLANPLLDIQGNPVVNATDVVIKGNNAIVTKSSLDENGAPVIDAAIVDISNCLNSQAAIPVAECISTVDLNEGLLIIPCVKVGQDVVTVHMEQRGNSSNWEVKFYGTNTKFSRDDDSGDDDNDDESDDDNDKKRQ